MPGTDFLAEKYPRLGAQVPRLSLAALPTPVAQVEAETPAGKRTLSIKYDDRTGDVYGGNKVRKLEYLFARALAKGRERVATFGAVGSNHALATTLYAKKAGLACTCFLSHQTRTPLAATTLNRHIESGTEIVRYGGAYAKRVRTMRDALWDKNAWVIPMGGSSWHGNLGFVAAGLELASQIRNGDIPAPERIYIGTGTMGTTIGIALGLASAGLAPEIHAVRVSDTAIMNEAALQRLLHKTAQMMRRLDTAVPEDLAARTSIVLRHEFFSPGYAHSNPPTDAAIEFAREQLGLTLEPTYTGKTMAAILADWQSPASAERQVLYWHTYNSVAHDVPSDRPLDKAALPEEFLRYFE